MKNVKKFTALLLVLVLTLSFAACSKKMKPTDYEAWYNDTLVPAYDSFLKTEDGKNAPSPSISLLLASDKYLKDVLTYIKSGTQPENGEVSEVAGVYTYAYGLFNQVFEFDTKTSSMKVTMTQSAMDDTRTEFVAVFAQRGDEFFIQYLTPDFEEYYEVRFTADGGSTTLTSGCTALPYTIFSQNVPGNFAKEK